MQDLWWSIFTLVLDLKADSTTVIQNYPLFLRHQWPVLKSSGVRFIKLITVFSSSQVVGSTLHVQHSSYKLHVHLMVLCLLIHWFLSALPSCLFFTLVCSLHFSKSHSQCCTFLSSSLRTQDGEGLGETRRTSSTVSTLSLDLLFGQYLLTDQQHWLLSSAADGLWTKGKWFWEN